MRHSFLENVVLLLVINFFANANYIYPLMAIAAIVGLYSDNPTMMENLLCYSAIFILPLLLLAHIFVLPIAYKKLENSEKFIYISKFIKKLKRSWKRKLIVLIITYFIFLPWELSLFNGGFKEQLLLSMMFGLPGSYIVLYLYWYIEDIIQKDKMNGLINKRYKL